MRGWAIAALVLVAGCGGGRQADEPEPDRVIASVGNGVGELREGGMKLGDLSLSMNADSPECAKRPAYVPLFAGAKIEGCLGMGAGGQITYTVPAAATDVRAFYKAAAQKAGLTDTVFEQGNTFGAHAADGRGFVLVAEQQAGEAQVSVMYGMGG